MILKIDKETLDKQGIPLDILFYLLSCYFDKPIDTQTEKDALSAHYAYRVYEKDKVHLTTVGKDKVEDFILNNNLTDEQVDRFVELANKLRELYPKGRKQGTAYMWRDSASIIAKRLKALRAKYNFEFTDEEAVNATKRYIDSFNGDYTYMQVLKYFISKKNMVTGEETSQLMSYIENEGDEDQPAYTDYMTQMR